MRANQAVYRVATMCRVLGVSPSGFYAWRAREPSARARSDEQLAETMGRIHRWSRGTYGSPRMHKELEGRGVEAGRHRVARVMRMAGLRGVCRRKGWRTTVRDRRARPAPDLVERDFLASEPDRRWAADVTYVPTRAGFVFLAVVLDAFSRRIVGWAMATHLRAELVVDALDMALSQRRPEEVIHHSDQGSQYTSIAFGQRCQLYRVRPSMGSVGDCYDNAMAESFFATLECELIDRVTMRNPREAMRELFDFIEGWYNPHRRHSSIDYLSPAAFERRYRESQEPKAALVDPPTVRDTAQLSSQLLSP